MGIPTLISTSTASDSSSVDITSGIDSTYDEYMFVYTDINPATDDAEFTFQVNAVDASGFNETITSSFFAAYHAEDDVSGAALGYMTNYDQAQGTSYQVLGYYTGSGGDECCAGILHLFNPSSTTYVKHFYSRSSNHHSGNYAQDANAAGYINITAAIDEISFKMESGNFDGTIKMWGVK